MLSVPMLLSQHFALALLPGHLLRSGKEILSEILIEAHLAYPRQFYIAQAKVTEMF